MKKSRVARAVVALLFLIGFGIYTYKMDSLRKHSRDVEAWGEAVELHPEGYGEVRQIESTDAPVDEATPEPSPEPTAEPADELAAGLPDIDVTSWEFMLANADNSIDEYEPPELATLEEQQFDARIIDALSAMAEDARAQGLSVFLSSGYRSYSEQAANFTRVCQNNGVADGKNSEGYYITMPAGCSEHQTGLCCDITDQYYPVKDSSLADTEMFKYMSQHCQDFGFIVRFPDGRQSVTGVMYEPFHFRYVGVEAATYIMENNICLEEFLALYE